MKDVLFRVADQSVSVCKCCQGRSQGMPDMPVHRFRTNQMAERKAGSKQHLELAGHGNNPLLRPTFPHAYQLRALQIRDLVAIAVSILWMRATGGDPYQQMIWLSTADNSSVSLTNTNGGSSSDCDACMCQVAEKCHRSIKKIAARKQCTVAEAVYRYNATPKCRIIIALSAIISMQWRACMWTVRCSINSPPPQVVVVFSGQLCLSHNWILVWTIFTNSTQRMMCPLQVHLPMRSTATGLESKGLMVYAHSFEEKYAASTE